MPQSPIRVLFVCHGNICRSTMAEFVLKDMVARRGLAEQFRIESAATSTEEIGNPVHPGTAAVLRNDGSLPVPFTATLRCDMPVTHPKVVDLQTGAFIGFDLTLQPDETLEIYRSTSDRLACTLTRAGVTENIFAKLDEDSTLTELQPGDNVLSMQAENGSGYLQASVSFYPMEAGILPEPLCE